MADTSSRVTSRSGAMLRTMAISAPTCGSRPYDAATCPAATRMDLLTARRSRSTVGAMSAATCAGASRFRSDVIGSTVRRRDHAAICAAVAGTRSAPRNAGQIESTCRPQPRHVVLPHWEHRAFEHISALRSRWASRRRPGCRARRRVARVPVPRLARDRLAGRRDHDPGVHRLDERPSAVEGSDDDIARQQQADGRRDRQCLVGERGDCRRRGSGRAGGPHRAWPSSSQRRRSR